MPIILMQMFTSGETHSNGKAFHFRAVPGGTLHLTNFYGFLLSKHGISYLQKYWLCRVSTNAGRTGRICPAPKYLSWLARKPHGLLQCVPK